MRNLSVKVPEALYQEMKGHAASNNISLSDLIRTSVERTFYLETEKVEPQYYSLEKELELKNQQIEQYAEAQQQSNMIIMQLTKQLEQQTLMLEDMRHKSLWQRVKAALGFAS